MSYIEFKDGQEPSLSAETLNRMQIELMKLVFPVGSTYITQTNINPAEILKFGVWERIKGKVCVGLDEEVEQFNTIGKTGGEIEHTLTISEIPSHAHTYGVGTNMTTEATYSHAMSAFSGGNPKKLDTSWSGSGESHNNLQPYEVDGYKWIRRN